MVNVPDTDGKRKERNETEGVGTTQLNSHYGHDYMDIHVGYGNYGYSHYGYSSTVTMVTVTTVTVATITTVTPTCVLWLSLWQQ